MISDHLCTGCGACFSVCQFNAIEMYTNKYGELVPHIDKTLCVNCNLCHNSCPQNSSISKTYPKKCYVAWSLKEYDIKNSSSGGVATVISEHQIKNNSFFFGCLFDEKLNLKHFNIDDFSKIELSRGSKYTQSSAYVCFKEIRELLIQNKHVVFIGTPCQVAGLLKFLNKKYENLITIDLICHGTPPNEYLKQHINSLNLKGKITKVSFRGGDYNQMLAVYDNDGILYKADRYDDLYFTAFYNNLISMENCYTCQYATSNRVSDITIGDFWGLKELNSINKISDRPSIILINTDNGENYFKQFSHLLAYEERDVSEGIRGNGRLNSPPGISSEAKLFRLLYKHFGFTKSIKYVNRYVYYIKNFSLKNIFNSVRKRFFK